MANENKESLTIGQALDIIIQNADKRITALETENKDLTDRVERMADYLIQYQYNFCFYLMQRYLYYLIH